VYALTDYRGQGQTIAPILVSIGQPPSGELTAFNAYVALSLGCNAGTGSHGYRYGSQTVTCAKPVPVDAGTGILYIYKLYNCSSYILLPNYFCKELE